MVPKKVRGTTLGGDHFSHDNLPTGSTNLAITIRAHCSTVPHTLHINPPMLVMTVTTKK